MNEERIPLEDELGDVLDKALRRSGRCESAVATEAGLSPAKLRDAIDYRYDFSLPELSRLAAVLGLNEVGLCALGRNRYPLPEIGGLPFCVRALRMRHGVGVSNAYFVGDPSGAETVLFDTGPSPEALRREWPASLSCVAAVFLTHLEAEHAGGISEVRRRQESVTVFSPAGAAGAGLRRAGEGETWAFGSMAVTAYSTPGHAAAHNCYLVSVPGAPRGRRLLIAGDLIFAGSAGGAYFCQRQLGRQVRRMLDAVPEDTVIAAGHGPMTTVAHERRFNPFLA